MSSYASDRGFASEGDPGREEKLVASKLIGFRRFGLSWDGSLTAVSDRSCYAVPGENTAEHRGLLWSAEMHPAGLVQGSVQVPVEGCTCGFYGYYTPELIDTTFNSNAWTCCAVVEVWGKVILGTKGFRAEKMQILGAVAPSELSHPAPGYDGLFPHSEIVRFAEARALGELYENRRAWQDTINTYGITEYASVAEMVAAHPPQDVSHLLPKPVEKSLPVTDGSSVRQWTIGGSVYRSYGYSLGPSWVNAYYGTPVPGTPFTPMLHHPAPGAPLPADHEVVAGCLCHWCEGVRALQELAQRALKED